MELVWEGRSGGRQGGPTAHSTWSCLQASGPLHMLTPFLDASARQRDPFCESVPVPAPILVSSLSLVRACADVRHGTVLSILCCRRRDCAPSAVFITVPYTSVSQPETDCGPGLNLALLFTSSAGRGWLTLPPSPRLCGMVLPQEST